MHKSEQKLCSEHKNRQSVLILIILNLTFSMQWSQSHFLSRLYCVAGDFQVSI